MLLLEAGVDTLEKVVATSRQKLEKLLSKPVAARLLQKAAWLLERKAQREEAGENAEEAGSAAEQELPAWSETYPFSDEVGAAYQLDITVHLDGRAQRRRHLVKLNEKDAWLSERSFEALLTLAVAAKTTDLGWVSRDRLGTRDTYHQAVRRLKRDLRVDGIDVERLIENNLSKQYRLSVPPQHITLDREMILRHYPEGKTTLADLPHEGRSGAKLGRRSGE